MKKEAMNEQQAKEELEKRQRKHIRLKKIGVNPTLIVEDGDDEAEVLVDDVDENEEIELAVETDDEILEDPLPIDVDTEEEDEVAFDENEMLQTEDEMDMSDDLLDNQEEECATENADIDDFASTSLDPEIEIENDMDMSDFS